MIFNNTETDLNQMLDKVKILLFSWLKENTITFAFDYHD